MPPHRTPLGSLAPRGGGPTRCFGCGARLARGGAPAKEGRGVSPDPSFSARDSQPPHSRRKRLFRNPTAFPRTSRLRRTATVPAFTVGPRQAVTAQTATRTARLSGLSPSSNPWKSCCACLPRVGRLWRIPSEPWTAFDKDRPSIGRLLKFSSLTPQDSARKTRRALSPRARKPASYLPGVRKPAGLLSGATGAEKTPATFRVPFLCAVRSRPPVLHAAQP